MNSTQTFSYLQKNPLNKIIGLSVILSVGFLLVILAGIYGNWFPIIIGIIFAVAHLPVAITKTSLVVLTMISILILQPPTPGLSLRLGSFDGFLIGEWCLFAYSIKPLFDIDENSYGLDNSGRFVDLWHCVYV